MIMTESDRQEGYVLVPRPRITSVCVKYPLERPHDDLLGFRAIAVSTFGKAEKSFWTSMA